MRLGVIGSGSTGNSYVLKNEEESIILDAGCRFIDVKKYVDYDVIGIKGCLITHKHLDHSGHYLDYLKSGIDVYTNTICKESLKTTCEEYLHGMEYGKAYKIGGFTVQAFHLIHDVECCGFLIKHKEIGKLLYITDTEYVPQNFSKAGINHALVECNHTNEKLYENYNEALAERVRYTHMELETCIKFLETINTSSLYSVCLCHLSSDNGDYVTFQRCAKKAVDCSVNIACPGLDIELFQNPF